MTDLRKTQRLPKMSANPQSFLPTEQLQELLLSTLFHDNWITDENGDFVRINWEDSPLLDEAITAINQLAIEAMLALIPEKMDLSKLSDEDMDTYAGKYLKGWNDCIDELRQQLESTKPNLNESEM